MSIMDPLVRSALIGIREGSEADSATGTAIDSLPLPSSGRERELLLKAGARAIYAMSGYVPAKIAAMEATTAEDLPICTPLVAELFKALLTRSEDELPAMAFTRMREARLVLAPHLLPMALDTRDAETRRLLHPLLGKRGLWLSRFNPAWLWASEMLEAPPGSVPANAQVLWQEGSRDQRIEVLRRVRAADPGLAREWILATWRREKAELRAELLPALKVHLSPADEPLLEQALDDRAGGVRAAAAEILRTLSTSAFAGRMLARADSLLTYSKGVLHASPPTSIDAVWQRDGISARPGGATGGAQRAQADHRRSHRRSQRKCLERRARQLAAASDLRRAAPALGRTIQPNAGSAHCRSQPD